MQLPKVTVFGNGTDAVSWTSEPTKRGTFSILSACVVTILLCAWTAVHLNIPAREDQRRLWFLRRQLWCKLGWLLFALLAPELVAYCAFYQLNKAKKLTKYFKERREEDGSEAEVPELSMTQAFYAIMGGYVLDVFNDDASPFPNDQTRFVLQHDTIQEMAIVFPQLLPRLSDAEIKDKSKASDIAKSVVCFQATWFVTQCMGRMAGALAVSLLELNTFGHCLCALLIYSFWWYKPLDTDQPTLIRGEQAEQFAAYTWLIAFRSDKDLDLNGISPFPIYERYKKIHVWEHRNKEDLDFELADQNRLISERAVDQVRQAKERRQSQAGDMHQFEMEDQPEGYYQSIPLKQSLLRPGTNDDDSSDDRDFTIPEFPFSAEEMRRIHVDSIRSDLSASEEMDYDNEVEIEVKGLFFSAIKHRESKRLVELAADLLKERLTEDTITYEQPIWGDVIADRVNNLPYHLSDTDSLGDTLPTALRVCLYISGILYGGLHALAWFATFRTSIEMYLWRVSTVMIIGFPFVVDIGTHVLQRLRTHHRKILTSKRVTYVIIWASFIAYSLARVYLVVECFLALTHSPIGVYEVLLWSTYVPHIT